MYPESPGDGLKYQSISGANPGWPAKRCERGLEPSVARLTGVPRALFVGQRHDISVRYAANLDYTSNDGDN